MLSYSPRQLKKMFPNNPAMHKLIESLWREYYSEKLKYDALDPTAGYLADKIVAGANITITEGTGADENKVKISVSGDFATSNQLDEAIEYLEDSIMASQGWNDLRLAEHDHEIGNQALWFENQLV